ncbi:MAG: carbohydrate kinase family protein [Butyrivibrio sp.]|nr:carbohydrate kinase family protein [Butyrivibrio sp.]
MNNEVTIIGAAIMDIAAGPVPKELFTKGSVPANKMKMSYGGDALNEATVLSILGVDTSLISVVGDDEIGNKVLAYLNDKGISTDNVTVTKGMTTGMNIVLSDNEGERYFITNPESSLRKLSLEHILPYVDDLSDIVSFASIFVSPMLGITEMAQLFAKIKEKPGRILISDMTTAKNGEKVDDLKDVLKHIDYLIPNEREAKLLTGEADPIKNARIFSEYGVKAVVIKCGKDGCVYKVGDEEGFVKTDAIEAVDTTGAGDSFVAGFIYGLTKGMDIKDCCVFANSVASLVIEDIGTTGNLRSLEQVLQRKESLSTRI